MKFSMMTYTMMRQPGFTPEDCVRVAQELKMEGIDWVTTYGRDPKELKKMSEDAGLTIAAHTFFVPGATVAEKVSNAEKSLDDACILGAGEGIGVCPGGDHAGDFAVSKFAARLRVDERL